MKELMNGLEDTDPVTSRGCDDVEGNKSGGGTDGKAEENTPGSDQNFGGKGEGNGEAHN